MNTLTRIKFNITSEDGMATSVTAFSKGKSFVAGQDHPRFANIVAMLLDEDSPLTEDDVESLFDVGIGLEKNFKKLTDRVSIRGGVLYFDMEPMHDALAKRIVEFYLEGHDHFMTLLNFMEKINVNPNPHSREQLFGWLENNRFAFAPDGDFIAYKGVNPSNRDDYDYESVNGGSAIVNGEPWNGRIPSSPGLIVEMPRSDVKHDPTAACHHGLHAGAWSYASNFASVTLRVKINPRDVVSVPNPGTAFDKLRVCRYMILGKVTAEDKSMLFVDDEHKTLALRQSERNRRVRVTKEQIKRFGPAAEEEAPKVQRPAKRVAKKVAAKIKKVVSTKAKAETPKPKFYEDFNKANFLDKSLISFKQLQWLSKEWDVTPAVRSSDAYAEALAKAAAARRRKLSANKLAAKDRTKLR